MASSVRNVCNVGKIAYKNTAVFLCDMQEKFRGNIQYFPQIIAVSSRILKAGKILDMPIIATEQYPKGLGPTVAELELQKNNIQAFPKTQFSMMTNDVQDLIKKSSNDIKSVVLCGIETHVCIQGTALSLLEEGYDVHIVVDGCSSRSMVDRLYAFDRLKECGAFLTTSESIILGLVGDSAHPKFRDVQKLIMDSAPNTGLLEVTKRS